MASPFPVVVVPSESAGELCVTWGSRQVRLGAPVLQLTLPSGEVHEIDTASADWSSGSPSAMECKARFDAQTQKVGVEMTAVIRGRGTRPTVRLAVRVKDAPHYSAAAFAARLSTVEAVPTADREGPYVSATNSRNPVFVPQASSDVQFITNDKGSVVGIESEVSRSLDNARAAEGVSTTQWAVSLDLKPLELVPTGQQRSDPGSVVGGKIGPGPLV